MNGHLLNKRKKRDTQSPSQVQSNHGRAEIRKVDSGINVSFKRGDVAGTKSLVYLSDLPSSSSYSMANMGNLNAIKEVLDRTEGKAIEHIKTENVDPIRVLEFGDNELDEKEGS